MKPSVGDKIVEQEKRERAKRKRMIILCIFMLIIVIGLAVAAFLWENARMFLSLYKNGIAIHKK